MADRFDLLHLAGSGAMGSVWRSLDRRTGATVALKLLHADATADIATRMTREAQVLAALRAPGVVRYVAHGRTEDGGVFLAMEWLEGEDLAARLLRGPLGAEEVVALLATVSAALAAVHQRGVIHRDLKPQNLMLVGGDLARVTVVDFGIARWDEAHFAMTRHGAVVGTPGYMAPEQCRGEPDLDPRTDVFALGCVAFECLCGRRPFVGESIMAVLGKTVLNEAPRVRSLCPEVPEAVDALVAAMLRREREARIADGAALREAVAALAGSWATVLTPRVAAPQPAPEFGTLSAAEQRLCSVVMFTDSGGAARATGLRPAVEAIAGEARGRLHPLGRDGFALVLSGDEVALDQALRAVRAGLAIARAMPGAAVAVATGRGALGHEGVTGEVIDRAAARVRAPEPASGPVAVAVDDATAELVEARFAVRLGAAGPFVDDDTERPSSIPTEPVRTLFVGRERELRTLDATWDEALADAVARAVVVIGDPGAGKTRLRDEWTRALAARGEVGATRLFGRAVPGRSTPLALAGSVVARACGIDDDTAPAQRRTRLRTRLATVVGDREVERVAWFLGETVAADFPADDARLGAARGDPKLMAEQVARAWCDWLRAELQRGPVALLLEDIHWADGASLELAEEALRELRDRPWMVAAFGRPELRQRFPDLWVERAALALPLGPLSRRAVERCVRAALPSCAEAVVGAIVERADGNAFVLEELIEARIAGRGDEVPLGVAAAAQASFDAMEFADRRVLRAASVYAGAFSAADVAALVGGDEGLAARLEALVRRGSLLRDGARFAFRHELLRDAAYAALTDDDRALGHRLAGAHLEAHGHPDAQSLAEHFERGARPERAAVQWARAAARCVGAYDLEGAIRCASRGIDAGATGELRGRLRASEAAALRWSGRPTEAAVAAEEALGLLPRGSEPWFRALQDITMSLWSTSGGEALGALAEQALACPERAETLHVRAHTMSALARALRGHPEVRARCQQWLDAFDDARLRADPMLAVACYQTRSLRAYLAGDLASYLTHKRRLDEAFVAVGDRGNACLNRDNIGHALTLLGRWAEARTVLQGALAEAEALRLPEVVAGLRDNLAPLLARGGQMAEALAMEREALAFFVARGHVPYEIGARTNLSEIALLAGDLDGAAREAQEALARAAETGERAPTQAHILLARISLARGDLAAAMTHAGAANATRGDGVTRVSAALVWAEALHAAGETAQAREVILDARDEVVTRAGCLGDGAARRSFLEDVPEHAAVLHFARAWARLA